MQRWLFRRELAALAGREVFYLDECGVEHRLYQEYGRAPRGERLYAEVAGSRRQRTSIISAAQNAKLVAPFVFEGSCNTEVVDTYFEKVLLPALPKGSVIVLDTPVFINRPARKNWWPPPAVNCSSSPLTRPISTPSNIFGPSSKRLCAASCQTPTTQPL